MEERRRSKRTELEAKLVIKRLDGGADSEEREVSIEITDVSKSGVGFICRESLTNGAVYEAYLTIWTREVLHVFLQISRFEVKAGEFHYGAVFIGMSETDVGRIAVYQTVNEAE